MATNILKRVWNQNRMTEIEDLSGSAFRSEIGGHTFEISGINDAGTAVSLSGTVTSVFVRADGVGVSIYGTVSNGKASVTLSEDCYTVPGRFMFTIYITANNQRVALYSCVGVVAASTGTTAAGSVPPLVTDSIEAGDISVSGTLTVAKRAASGTPSAAGWYRILSYTAASEQIAQGRYTMFIKINVGDLVTDAHEILLATANSSISFLDETGKANGGAYIDKIRYTYSGAMAYVDVHFTASVARTVWAYFDAYLPLNYQSRISSQQFVAVADAPTGETIANTYTFIGSTEPIDISSEFTFNSTDISITSSNVIAWFDPASRRVSIDYALRASAVFATGTTFMTCSNSTHRIGTQTDFPAMIYNNSSSQWDAYYVRAYTNGQFQQRLSANAMKVYGHIEYYV